MSSMPHNASSYIVTVRGVQFEALIYAIIHLLRLPRVLEPAETEGAHDVGIDYPLMGSCSRVTGYNVYLH